MNVVQQLLLDITDGHRCTCGCFKAMSTQRESVCCHDIEEMKSMIVFSHLEMCLSCITQHADFNNVFVQRCINCIFVWPLTPYGSTDVPADENR